MSRWNHFGNEKYEQIPFSSVAVGDKFRIDRFKNKRRRKDIICLKTGPLTFIEFISKRETKLFNDNLEVSHFENKYVSKTLK